MTDVMHLRRTARHGNEGPLAADRYTLHAIEWGSTSSHGRQRGERSRWPVVDAPTHRPHGVLVDLLARELHNAVPTNEVAPRRLRP